MIHLYLLDAYTCSHSYLVIRFYFTCTWYHFYFTYTWYHSYFTYTWYHSYFTYTWYHFYFTYTWYRFYFTYTRYAPTSLDVASTSLILDTLLLHLLSLLLRDTLTFGTLILHDSVIPHCTLILHDMIPLVTHSSVVRCMSVLV